VSERARGVQVTLGDDDSIVLQVGGVSPIEALGLLEIAKAGVLNGMNPEKPQRRIVAPQLTGVRLDG